jgi:hypothetical protein
MRLREMSEKAWNVPIQAIWEDFLFLRKSLSKYAWKAPKVFTTPLKLLESIFVSTVIVTYQELKKRK